MPRRVAVVAAGTSRKWGIFPGTYRDLISEAGKATFDSNPRIKPADIEGFILASVFPERSVFQSHVATLAAETVGVKPLKLFQRVENMCGSGTIAIRTAYMAIASGLADVVMVIGAEKMHTPQPVETYLSMLGGVDREYEGSLGVTAPAQFALAAQSHMQKYGTTQEQMSLVSVKNHTHAANNPYAHFPKACTLEEVLNARPVTTPFTILDCSPITDGAAGMILMSEDKAWEYTDKPVFILGTGQAASGFNYANVPSDLGDWTMLQKAAQDAYRMAGVTAEDIDVAEVHDCFSISEIIITEELGFAAKGEGGSFIADGRSDYGGDVVINPRGGLLGCGHPLGATGVAQGVELFRQLRGEAGVRQVEDARMGLGHNLSGVSEHHVLIYGRGDL
ncbi:thiolase family protein [Paradesulfitobacterium ferrireducens]|uniref:thiolase family protein n=1 Tax=Paradesulfitobacterium ferrireducens TaxID=2816476 RepID=UPI001A9053FF|nr:thiolase family protein [Paradesulfitobacterium ferrireducens]